MSYLKRITGVICTAGAVATGFFMISPAHADAVVDRSFGMIRPLNGSPSGASPLSMFPHGAVPSTSKTVQPPDGDNDPHGSYTVDVMGATIYSKNIVYVTPFSLPPHSNARITVDSVTYSYTLKSRPAGFEAALCWKDSKTCLNVSNNSSGETSIFNGRDAMRPFLLQYQVTGVGAMQAITGDAVQIVVNYRVWPQQQ
jgi:flagellar protein FlhE